MIAIMQIVSHSKTSDPWGLIIGLTNISCNRITKKEHFEQCNYLFSRSQTCNIILDKIAELHNITYYFDIYRKAYKTVRIEEDMNMDKGPNFLGNVIF